MQDALPYTGERMVPEHSSPIQFWNHIYRYRFAASFVKNKRVLDIACGEGYGSKALAMAGAASVMGMDVSEEACRHARSKYGLDITLGDAQNMPLPDKSVDVVVSFETIEHLERQDLFLDECVRVLQPGGMLIVSTPNRDVYSERGKLNSFHHYEMNEQEFVDCLTSRFSQVSLYSQYLKSAAWWSLGRSLGAESSPWANIKGFWKFREFIRRTASPQIFGEGWNQAKLDPVQAIFARESSSIAALNPYRVRPRSQRSNEQPYYFLAVARV